jgi:hypothetical protein
MSSSRSIAAARQRRGVESAPPIKNNSYASNSVGKDNFNNNQQQRPNYRTTKSNIYQDNNATSNMNNNANQVSKLSVSDAFALVTLRLGRVELIMNKLQSEGIIDANNNINSENLGNSNNNNNNFDDTILQNIITRLDGLDKKTVSNDLNQKLQSQYNVLSEDVKQTKEVVIKLQSFIMDISQKLNSFITTQETINEDFFDLRDDFHNSLIDPNGTIQENDINQQIENEEHVDENNHEYHLGTVSEHQENDQIQSLDNESSDNQNSKNLDSLIANNLDNFTETTTNNEVEQVITTDIPKNKQKNNKNRSMNMNVNV